ncbi:hypothetical protein I532_03905 [Brevibacillus borstelensis AK1]|uniref:Uncharacterized protein n=1 Tax=Brevibacillus borstelensis AK1 TaxID=1300222 RepID=M8DEF1_9BACL|nr:hypothetical protein [Brevibacillus borstelensis]EMT54719.1 hypothetical protein I532_03905 [Brevibacillus borstelensis AK1]
MAQYKAHPAYAVNVGGRTIHFDYFGQYRTDDPKEIAVLDALCPTWIKRVDEPEPKTEEPEAPAKPARKSSAK